MTHTLGKTKINNHTMPLWSGYVTVVLLASINANHNNTIEQLTSFIQASTTSSGLFPSGLFPSGLFSSGLFSWTLVNQGARLVWLGSPCATCCHLVLPLWFDCAIFRRVDRCHVTWHPYPGRAPQGGHCRQETQSLWSVRSHHSARPTLKGRSNGWWIKILEDLGAPSDPQKIKNPSQTWKNSLVTPLLSEKSSILICW